MVTADDDERATLSSEDSGSWLVRTTTGTTYLVCLSDTSTIERIPDPGNPRSDWTAPYLNAHMHLVEMGTAVIGDRWYFVRSSPDPRILCTPWIYTSPVLWIRRYRD